MQTISKLALGLSLALGGAGAAEAKVIPEVRQFMAQEIHKQAVIVRQGQLGQDQRRVFAPATEANYSLATFALRLRGEVGFDVGFGTVKVVPTAEFFWMQ